MYSNVTTSTRINSSSVHTYILVCFIRNYYIGLLANNTTWCQNRGCICISSTRRTYGRIHAVSCIHPVIQTSNNNSVNRIISKEKEREDIQGEILQGPHSSSNPRVFPVFYTQSSNLQIDSIYRINSTRNTRLILCRHLPAVAPRVSSILHGRIKTPAPYNVPGPYSSSRLPVILPGRNSILHGSQPTRSPSSSSQAAYHKEST